MKKIILFLIIIITSLNIFNIKVKADTINCTTTLKKGISGETVKILQTKLNTIMNCNLDIDGIYGTNTESCVLEFQKKYNITKTGTMNKTTCKTLNEYNKEKTSINSLKSGSRGTEVKKLQMQLNKIMNCNLDEDGIFGEKTKKCIKKFQKAIGTKETGTFNETTSKKLNQIVEEVNNIKIIKKGSSGEKVKEIQTQLNKIMNCNLDEDGLYGNDTKKCIMKFQKATNLETTGIINKMTYYKLMNEENKIEKETLKIKAKSLIILEDGVYIKETTSKKANIEKVAYQGQIYEYKTILKRNGINWYKINLDNSYGYIKEESISTNFILVDKSLQKLIFHKDEKNILNTEVITGMSTNHDTPSGAYKLKVESLEKGRTLRGYNDDGTKYASYVDYWMPFIVNRGIGFHDASWRDESEFTDDRHLYDGSHGCVNMKSEDAKILFNNINEDIDVIIRD